MTSLWVCLKTPAVTGILSSRDTSYVRGKRRMANWSVTPSPVVEPDRLNTYGLSDTTVYFKLLPPPIIWEFCVNWGEFVPNLWPISAID